MAPKKAHSKRTPSPVSSYISSSEDEPQNQAKPSQVPNKTSGAAVKATQSVPPKHPKPDDDETADESSDESTAEQSSEDEQPASKKRPTQQQQPPPPPAAAEKKGREAPPSSDSDSESEDDSPPSLRRETRTPVPPVEPAVSKPAGDGEAGSSKKQGDKKRKPPEPASPSTPKGKNDKKHKVPEAAPPSASKEDNNEATKKQFERVWTHDGEMAILEALVAFKKKHGHEPTTSSEFDTLYNMVKMSFHTDFSRAQLRSKVKRLRRKYSAQLSKEDGRTSKRKPLDADAQNAVDLAKVIWDEGKKNKDAEREGRKHASKANGPLENGGKSLKLIRPKAEAVESAMTASEKSKGDGANCAPLALNELFSSADRDNGESPIIDFVANEFNWMDRDSLRRSFAVLSSAECKIIEHIWNRLKLKEMEFQIHRLEAAKEIIQIVKDKEDQWEG